MTEVVKVLGEENGRFGLEVMGKTFLSFEKMNIVDGKVSIDELKQAAFIGPDGRKKLVKLGRWYT